MEAKQKSKLLYIAEALYKYTDEKHAMGANALIDYLAERDIFIERKTVISDIKALKEFGLDIGVSKQKDNSGYYIISRSFELAELKLITDAILSSRYITAKKSKELIGKLEELASPSERRELKREVFVDNRVKSVNESIYYNVDKLHSAIQQNEEITFKYLDWTADKQLVPRHDGKLYRVSPWALTVKDENYYLVAYDDTVAEIRHYRVDKLKDIKSVRGSSRKGKELFRSFDVAEYTSRNFGMFGGVEETVSLSVNKEKVGIIFDRFGKDVDVRPISGDRVSIRVRVIVSGQFFGWLAGIGNDISILKPESVKTQYIDHLNSILSTYGILKG